MTAEGFAVRVYNFTGDRQTIRLLFGFEISIDETGVIAVRNKTDFLRLFLFRHRKIVVARGLSRITLRKFSQREQRPRKLILRQLPKKVRLILVRIASAQKPMTIRRFV